MGKNKEAEVRHGVAHVKKGRKGKRWLRQMDMVRVSLNGLIQLPLMVGAGCKSFKVFALNLYFVGRQNINLKV